MRTAVSALLVACTQTTTPTPQTVVAAPTVADTKPVRDLKPLYGATIATPGPLFASDELGAPMPIALPHFDGAEINLETDRIGLDAIAIKIPDCARLAAELAAAWGAGPVWLDPATHHRARLDPTCVLRFDRYADPSTWIDRTTTAVVPLAIIGMTATKLRAQLGKRIENDSPEGDPDPAMHANPNSLFGRISWQGLGVGPSDDPARPRTSITAWVSHGTIVGLVVRASVDKATGIAIRDRITELYGPMAVHSREEGMIEWSAEPPLWLDLEGTRAQERVTGDTFRIEVGALRASGMR